MKTYLVCYDIEDDRERQRVAKCLKRYGRRVQKSVFEVYFYERRDRMEAMLSQLRKIVEDETSLRFYRLSVSGMSDSWTLDGKKIQKPGSAVVIM